MSCLEHDGEGKAMFLPSSGEGLARSYAANIMRYTGKKSARIFRALFMAVFLSWFASGLSPAGWSFAGLNPVCEGAPVASKGPIYGVYIHGNIEGGLAAYAERAIRQAREAHARAIVFSIDTFGGRVDAATEIRDLILGLDIPTVAFIKGRAWSAGALIALACEKIVMSPGSSIGAAETIPREEKNISALRGEFEATAESRKRDPKVASAMVDADVEIKGLVDRGKILTLSAEKAKKVGFIDALASSPEEALKAVNIPGGDIIFVPVRVSEKIARFVTDPVVSSLLLALGFLGLLAEITTPGWGVPGTLGTLMLALFFGGRVIAGIAGLWAVAIFLIGVILLLIELFAIPGFGITGIAGILAILASLFMSFNDMAEAAGTISIAFLITITGGAFIVTRLGRSPFWGRLVLSHRQEKSEGYVSSEERASYLGATGRTLTVLRPAGVILIGDKKLDAISEGEYIPRGVVVTVIHAEGGKLMVRPQEDSE